MVQALEEKVTKENYGKYLRRVYLRKVRGFTERSVSFDFPVTAIVGPNGGGKTTVLGAAGLPYKSVQPGRFFAKSGRYDVSMRNWAIEYDLVDKSLSPKSSSQRTASFPTMKWNRRAVDREVLIFGVARTVPATERKELSKAVGSSFSAAREVQITAPVAQAVELILAKNVESYHRLYLKPDGTVSLFSAATPAGDQYSEFHFGAGEASVIRMVAEIEEASDNALILIEEIENGLHPIATQRMVEYLLDVAKRKSAQIIFTTHSNDALAPLPSKAIWAAYNGEVLQGKLDITALRTITGQVDAKLAIFVEDAFAERVVQTALRHHGGFEVDAIAVHAMGGADPAIEVNRQHNVDPTMKFPSICVVDGDKADAASPTERIYLLPGDDMPERHVFDTVLNSLDEVAAKLTLAMQLPLELQERVRQVVANRAMTNRDRHLIFQQIGADLDFTSEVVVAGAFCALWAQINPDDVDKLIGQFEEHAPKRSPTP
jgi:predicted ATPase